MQDEKAEAAVEVAREALRLVVEQHAQGKGGANSTEQLGTARAQLGQALVGAGRFALAVEQLEEGRKAFALLGDKRREAGCLVGLGYCALHTDQPEPASACFGQAFKLSTEATDVHGQANALFGFGAAREEVARLNLDKARLSFKQARELYASIGNAQGLQQCAEAMGESGN